MMNKNTHSRRQFLQLIGIATGTVALAACATPVAPGQPAAESGGAAANPADLTLRYRSWHSAGASEGDAAWYEWLETNYPEASGGTQVEFEFVPFGAEYLQKVLADSAAGTSPDLLHSSIIWAREIYDRGVLLDLDDYIADVPELAEDQFIGDATTEYRSKNGKFYGVPWEGPDSGVIAVNSTLLAEAGFDPRGADIQTWEDFIGVAEALTVRDGDEVTQAGYLVQSHRYIEHFASWMRSNGGALHDSDFTAATFNDERAVQIMQMQLDLLNEHKVSFPIYRNARMHSYLCRAKRP
jgi:multiple sugar transport system substrate-binding protein